METNIQLSYGKAEIGLISDEERAKVPTYMQAFLNYRKSGLSLNHVIGCPLNCGYCVRHFWGNWDMKSPHMLCTDEEAVAALVNHPLFIPHVTPIQLFNKATDPFLPGVKPHTHAVLRQLDQLGLTNMVLVITRFKVTEEDMALLEGLQHIKVSLFFTYSGITNPKIEPIAPTGITVNSIRLAARLHKRTKIILYWRPIVPGWNDDDETMRRVLEIGALTDAIVFTGYYHKAENFEYFRQVGVEVPYQEAEFQRRKVLPLELDQKVVRLHREAGIGTPLFRKTSCGATFAHGLPDYNGHWGVRELCDICPLEQQRRCATAHVAPAAAELQRLLDQSGFETDFVIEDGHIWTADLGEERRYFLQHTYGYQMWDIDWPHFQRRHGRSPIGYSLGDREQQHYHELRQQFHREAVYGDD